MEHSTVGCGQDRLSGLCSVTGKLPGHTPGHRQYGSGSLAPPIQLSARVLNLAEWAPLPPHSFVTGPKEQGMWMLMWLRTKTGRGQGLRLGLGLGLGCNWPVRP